MTYLILACLGIVIGWYSRELLERLKSIQKLLKLRRKQEEPPKSSIVEHDVSPTEMIRREQEDLIRSLNQ